MDGIVMLDGALKIVRVNPAAERLFAYAAKDLIGQEAKWFLAGDCARLLDGFTRDLAAGQQRWVPSQLTVLRADRSRFPAEATLS